MEAERMVIPHNRSSATPSLPDDLIVEEVLPKLPVKSLVRFKSVCKCWMSIISSPKFAKLHLKLSSFGPRFVLNTLVFDDDADPSIRNQLYLLGLQYDENRNNNAKELVPLDLEDADGGQSTVIRLVGSCDGLLCLYVKGPGLYLKYFSLWNPTIHQHRTVKLLDDGSYSYVDGFGYVPSLDDYRIVALFESIFHESKDLYVFTFRTGLWKKINGRDDHYKSIRCAAKGTLIGDTMYFVTDFDEWRLTKRIVGVNLVTEQFEHIPWMDWLGTYGSAKIFQMEGCMSMQCYLPREDVWDVWMCKKSSDWNSWEKLFSVIVRQSLHFCYFPEIRSCFVQQHSRQLRLINPGRGTQEHPQESIDFEDIESVVKVSHVYVESLISPLGNAT